MKAMYGLAALMFLLLTAPLSAQQDSVMITIYDRTDLQMIITPEDYRGFRGDTVTFMAVAIDTITGDTLNAEIIWSTDNPGAVDIDSGTGFATFLNRGRYRVYADVARITAMVIYRQQDDGFWSEVFQVERQSVYAATGVVPDTLTLEEGDAAQLCAYLVDETGLWYRGAESCPSNLAPNGPRPTQFPFSPLPVDTRLGSMVGS